MSTAIVLVDDEKMILDSLKGQLRTLFDRRFAIEAAENVPEAWELIDELHEDGVQVLVVVSDWLMPGVRGDEFLCDIRERYPDIVTIMLTGHADADAVKRVCTDGSVHSVMYKPWSADDLKTTISSALEQLD